MRHTLLPPKERAALRRDYYIRLAIVAGILLGVASVVAAVSLLPAYLYARETEQRELVSIAALRKDKEESGVAAIENELKADTIILEQISTSSYLGRASSAINAIANLRGKVKLDFFAFTKPLPPRITVVVQGIAPTREQLLMFKNNLETTLPEALIELPISDLARNTDLPFSMQISYTEL